jgi:hypothetical protein
MKRRDFLRNSALTAGALALGLKSSQAKVSEAPQQPDPQNAQSRLGSIGSVSEPARELPVVAETDVVIVGGGPAGVSAAIAAARSGASVMLLERYSYLGGLWTGGGVLPVLNTWGADASGQAQEAIRGTMTDVTSRLFSLSMAIHPKAPLTDPEATKYILAEVLDELGVRVVYHALATNAILSGDRIDAVILETKSGRIAVKGRFFIDCSGDGDLFAWVGEPHTERLHHIGAMWRVGNAANLTRGDETPIAGVRLLHTGGEKNQDGLDVFNLSRLQLNMRRYMWQQTQELRSEPGCDDLFLLDTPSQLGVRCTRVLSARHIVTMDESMHFTAYPDVIGRSGGSIPFTYGERRYRMEERPVWQIPYRALLPQKTLNLLVAGRCFGFDEPLTYDAREIGTCFVTGHAAGVAAGLAVANRCAADEVDVSSLQTQLRQQGAIL